MREFADLPLHGGKAPPWLFHRMVKLSRAIMEIILMDEGPASLLKRLSHPVWFQSLGAVLGFDWHSSGLTTTTGGALKIALSELSREYGIYVAGGKGKTSLRTPDELRIQSEVSGIDPEPLIGTSRLVAKIDNSCVQDGYNLYFHLMVYTPSEWTVIQQGMNGDNRMARRYHWFSPDVSNWTIEPHSGIASEQRRDGFLNLVKKESLRNQLKTLEFLRGKPEFILSESKKAALELPKRHQIYPEKDILPRDFGKTLLQTYEARPDGFDRLLLVRGTGPRFLRALSLVVDVIYGAPPSFEDFTVYSFAHGGKDGIPYPVDRTAYDASIDSLEQVIRRAKVSVPERDRMFAALKGFYGRTSR